MELVELSGKRLMILVSILTSLSVALVFNLLMYGLPSRADTDVVSPIPATITQTTTTQTVPTNTAAPVVISVDSSAANYYSSDSSYHDRVYYLEINGSNFTQNLMAQIDGQLAETFYVSSTKLIAVIGTAGAHQVVLMDTETNIASDPFLFNVLLADVADDTAILKPAITGLDPANFDAFSSNNAYLDIKGNNFTDNSVVWIGRLMNGKFLWLSSVSIVRKNLPLLLQVDINKNSLIALGATDNTMYSWIPRNYYFQVCNNDSNKKCSGNSILTVNNPTPNITNMTVGGVGTGSATVSINGLGFLKSSVVFIKVNNGSSARINATVNSSNNITVSVFREPPSGAPVTFTVSNPPVPPATAWLNGSSKIAWK